MIPILRPETQIRGWPTGARRSVTENALGGAFSYSYLAGPGLLRARAEGGNLGRRVDGTVMGDSLF
jgi:hypothetical protein